MTYTVGKNYMLPVGHPNRCGRKLQSPLALVYHYTANFNQGADDIANARYFGRAYEHDNGRIEEKGTDREFVYASAHYTVDQDSVQMCIPENEVAYHVGAYSYTALANRLFSTSPNNHTIGIELCVNAGNDWDKTCELGIELGADIMIRNNIPIEMVLRHYDITGKNCPAPFVNLNIREVDPRWVEFKNKLAKRVAEKKAEASKPAVKVAYRAILDGKQTMALSDHNSTVAIVKELVMSGAYNTGVVQRNTDGVNLYSISVKPMTVTASALNVRSAPKVASDNKVGVLYGGNTVWVLSVNNGWAKIRYNGKEAYVSAGYLK